jgi:hypothetical protein
MPTYRITGLFSGTKVIGEFKARSAKAAIAKALESEENHITLCHQCNDELELDDIQCQEAIACEIGSAPEGGA